MLCPGVRGRVVGVVGRMIVPVLGGCAAGMSLGVDCAAGIVIGVLVVCVALVIRIGESLRGSLLGDRISILMSFHGGGGVRTTAGSCGGDLARLGNGSGEGPFVGRLGDGRGCVGGPRDLRGLRGSVSDGGYVFVLSMRAGTQKNLNCVI